MIIEPPTFPCASAKLAVAEYDLSGLAITEDGDPSDVIPLGSKPSIAVGSNLAGFAITEDGGPSDVIPLGSKPGGAGDGVSSAALLGEVTVLGKAGGGGVEV